jgi:hypothetical protein
MKRWIGLFLLLLTLLSCNYIRFEEDTGDEGVEIYTPETVLWEDATGDGLKVYTNDRKYTYPNKPSGVRFWKMMPDALDASADLSGDLSKLSGHVKGTYGVIFSAEDSNNCLMVLIDTERSYAVVKITDGLLSYLKEWTFSDKLIHGYNQHNRIRIENLTGGHYRIYFNDTEETLIIDNTLPVRVWGNWGFTASIYGGEDFPDHPVDVRFRY